MNIEIIPWSESFEIGIKEIDDQHKYLVKLINDCGNKYTSTLEESDIENIFVELLDYAKYHFSSEEYYWNTSYIDKARALEHHNQHESFIVELSELPLPKGRGFSILKE